MARVAILKKIKESVLNEYDHRCAVCGGDRPQLHHIDEEADNNDVMNLLPLCPNCHLKDQHNPTRKFDIPKLKLFRVYKDPAILKPQFHPIYIRQLFLDDVEVNEFKVDDLEEKCQELVEFINNLEMGVFYSKRLEELIGPFYRGFVRRIGGGPDRNFENQRRIANLKYRQKLIENRDSVKLLIIEILRYQNWANA